MSLTDDFMPALACAAMVAKDRELAAAAYETVREDIEGLLRQAIGSAQQRELRETEDALFAACAFIDEVLLASSWLGREQWLRHPLQQVHFNTTNAGDEFYQRLTDLRSRLPGQEFEVELDGVGETPGGSSGLGRDTASAAVVSQPQRGETAAPGKEGTFQAPASEGQGDQPELRETLELYLTCLALGFKGRYFRADDQSVIRAHLHEGLFRLGRPASAVSERIFPELQRQSGLNSGRHGWFNGRAVFLFFVLTTAAGLLLYAGLFVHMSVFVDRLS